MLQHVYFFFCSRCAEMFPPYRFWGTDCFSGQVTSADVDTAVWNVLPAFSRLFVEVFCSCSESSGCWSIWCQCDRRAGCRSEGDSQPDCWWSPPQGRPPAAPPLSYNQEKPSSKTTTLSLLFVKCSDWVIFTDHIDKRWKSNVWIFSHVSTSFGHWQVQTVIKAPDSIVETSSQIKLRILLV